MVKKTASEIIAEKTRQNYWTRTAKPKKYKMTTRKAKDYVVLDFETTGFRAASDQIIQIGAVKYFNHERVDKLNMLVNPERTISSRITQLTKITNEMVEHAPTIDRAIGDLLDFIGDLPIVAHNASFDMGFLYALDGKDGVTIPEYSVIDTVKLARKVITETPNHKLTTLTHYLQLEHNAHDALGDCLATAAIYQYCLGVRE